MSELKSEVEARWQHIQRDKLKHSTSFNEGINPNDSLNFEQPHTLFFRFSFLVTDVLAVNLFFGMLLVLTAGSTNPNSYLLLFITTNIFWIVSSYITALYFAHQKFFIRTAQAFMIYSMFTLFFIILFKQSYSRLFIILSFSGFCTALLISRTILIGTQHFLQQKALATKVIILGCNELSQKFATTLSIRNPTFNVLGFFDNNIPNAKDDHRFPVLGSIGECLPFALRNYITDIYSTIPPESNPDIYEIAHNAEMNFIRFKFIPDFTIFIKRTVHVGYEAGMPVLSLHTEPLQQIENRFKKRGFDIIFSSLVILFILSWLVPIIALLIKIESRGPVFFKQIRSGKNNKPFLCFKFRSLKVNKDADKKQVTRHDDRYTRIGKFLRKTNLDELPQFFNVLQGYMSVVGPRPHMLKHTEEYSNMLRQYMVRHFVKPGVTGWAQINGYRGEIHDEEQLYQRVEHDIKYMETWSMWLDLRIIFLTIYSTFSGDKNAY